MVIEKKIEFETELVHFLPRQLEAVNLLDSGQIKFLLYGGALGGGKSYFLRWIGVRFLASLYYERGMKNVPIMLACEDYPSLKDRQLVKIGVEFPPWLGKMVSDHKLYGRCFILHPDFGSGIICFRNLDDPSKYSSAEFALIAVDELTKNSYEKFTFLRTRLRWMGLHDMECPFIAGTNPGSMGHGWVKQLWMDKNFPPEWASPIDYRSAFAYVPSKADDNPYLDASYWDMLNTLPASIRPAFREGNWDVFLGQAFPELTKETHGIEPVPVPENAPLYMCYDWGFGAPFSLGWWWIDADGRPIRFKEWYGWDGTPNKGLRLPDSAVAEGIEERERKWGIWIRKKIRYAGRDCFAKRPDYRGGGQGPPTSEVFAKHKIYLTPADDSRRDLKIRQFRERLRLRYEVLNGSAAQLGYTPKIDDVFGYCWTSADGGLVTIKGLKDIALAKGVVLPRPQPSMLIYNTCEQFFRTIPVLVMDKNDLEDVDTKGEDHAYDETCHICMARPLAMKMPEKRGSVHDHRIDELMRPAVDDYEEWARREQGVEMGRLGGVDLGPEVEVDDGDRRDMVDTIR